MITYDDKVLKRSNEQLSEKINKTILNQTFQNQYQGLSLNTKYAIIDANILILRPNLSIPFFSPFFHFVHKKLMLNKNKII